MTQVTSHEANAATVPVGSAVGTPISRVDGAVKASGAARFAAEFSYPGLTHAALVHATVARGRITRIDTAAAAAVPGVIAVLTHENAPKLKSPRPVNLVWHLGSTATGSKVNYLGTDQVHWDGQPVAVVVAETSAAAREAAALVEVEYQELPAAVDFTTEQRNATLVKGTPFLPGFAKKGDAEAALAAAAVKIDQRYTTSPLHHNALEPHATTAVWEGDRLTVHDSTQGVTWCKEHLAHRLGIPTANVQVISPYVGGGFGGKSSVWAGTLIAALAARAVRRPVRLVVTRKGVNRTVGGRIATAHRIALGADRDGKLTSLIHISHAHTGKSGGTPEQTTSAARHMYHAQNVRLEQRVVKLDLVPNTWMRAPGEAIGTFVLESAMDELAYELGMDPIELRMRNEPEKGPVNGRPFTRRRLREAYEQGAARFGWSERTPEPGSMRDGQWLVGMGVATAFHPSLHLIANVAVRLSADGSVLVQCGFQDMGMGGATAQAQIAADALGVPFESVRVEYGDSALPSAPGALNSNQTGTVATSVLAACDKLKKRMDALARRSGTVGQGYAATLVKAGLPSVEVAVGSDNPLGKVIGRNKFWMKGTMSLRFTRATLGAMFCEVRVDADTGEVRVSRLLGVFDVGRVINPKTASSQLRGAMVMGLGMALSERAVVDPRNGRTMSAGLDSYYVPVHADIPQIDVSWLGEPDPSMPLGLVGLGEIGTSGVTAAVANAVFHATGKRVRDLPITLDKLL